MLANLDTEGTRIGVLAARAGVSHQAVGKLLAQVEAAGYATTSRDPNDSRATAAMFTTKGRRMLSAVLDLVEEFEAGLAKAIPGGDVERVLCICKDGSTTLMGKSSPSEDDIGPGARRRWRSAALLLHSCYVPPVNPAPAPPTARS